MKFKDKILIKALNWRISYLRNQYNFRDDEFIVKHEHIENKRDGVWTDYYYKMQIERDKIMGKIYKLQDIIREIELESNPIKVSDNDKVIGVLFLVFIALSWYGLSWFNQIMN